MSSTMYDTLLETIELVVLITYVRSFTYLPENLLNLIKFETKASFGYPLVNFENLLDY